MSSCDNKPGLIAVPEGGLWTAQHVAAVLNMSTDWVWRQVRTDAGLPYIRLGRCVRFDPAKVREWLATQPQGGAR